MEEDDGEVLPVLAASAAVGIGLGLLTAKLLGDRWNDVELDALASAPGMNAAGTAVRLTFRW